MLFKILIRVGSVLLFGMLLLLRACLFTTAFNHSAHLASHPSAAFGAAPPIDYRGATLVMASDNSGWIMFNSTDPQTGQSIRHSRLTATSGALANGQPAPPNIIEVTEEGLDDHHIRLTLQAPPECPGITSVHATFGTHPATLAARPLAHEAGCTVELLDYAGVLQSLRDADTLTVSAGGGPDIRFNVAGLSWD